MKTDLFQSSGHCWVLSQLFYSTLSSSSRDSIIPLHFLPLEWYHLHIWGCWYFSQQSWFQLWFIQPAFHMMYSAYKLNKQGDNIQPCHNSFPDFELFSCSMSVSNCCFLTYIQVSQETGKVVWYSHLFKSLSQFVMIHEVKGLMFFWNSLAFSVIQWMLAVWSLVPLPFLNPACTSGSSQFTSSWSLAWRILSITLLAWKWAQLYGCLNILWNHPSLGLEWKLIFSSPVATAEFFKFADILSAVL